MFKRISEAEHKAAMAALEETHSAYLQKLAGAVNLKTENMSQEQIAEAIFSAVSDQENELNQINAQLDKANQEAESNKSALDAALERVNNQAETIEGITKLFGEKAQADGFNLVEAVGDIVPEPQTGTDPIQPAQVAADKEIITEFDQLAADYKAGNITLREFVEKTSAVKPGKL